MHIFCSDISFLKIRKIVRIVNSIHRPVIILVILSSELYFPENYLIFILNSGKIMNQVIIEIILWCTFFLILNYMGHGFVFEFESFSNFILGTFKCIFYFVFTLKILIKNKISSIMLSKIILHSHISVYIYMNMQMYT